jgi:hypothetical protein
MRCPVCVKQELRSHLYGPECSHTLAYGSTYHDEDGVYHNHDPNIYREAYRCSNGHVFVDKIYKECPAPGCEVTGSREFVVKQEDGTWEPI